MNYLLSIISKNKNINIKDLERYCLDCQDKKYLTFIPVDDDAITDYKEEFYQEYPTLQEYLICNGYEYNKELKQYGSWENLNYKFEYCSLLDNILVSKNGKTDITLQIKDINFKKSLLNLPNNQEYFSTHAVVLDNNWYEDEEENWDKNFYNKFLKENQDQFLTVAYCGI